MPQNALKFLGALGAFGVINFCAFAYASEKRIAGMQETTRQNQKLLDDARMWALRRRDALKARRAAAAAAERDGGAAAVDDPGMTVATATLHKRRGGDAG